MKPSCILFDLGNVLLLHNAQRRLTALSNACGRSTDDVAAMLKQTGIVEALDLGHAEASDLAATLSDFAGKTITADEAVRLWLTVFEPNLALWNTLPRLEARYTLGLFSNNPPFIQSIFPRKIAFKHIFLSPQFHATKPDIKIFNAVKDALGLPPAHILFVDDKKENTDQACSLGWNAIEFKSNDQLDQELTRLGIW